jgi:RNA polymerase sigma factor (sigma-70 family)
MNDESLLKACVAGDPKGQRLLFDTFAPKMLTVAMRYIKDKERAEDVLQDAFVKVFQNIQNFKLEGSLEGWIRRIVVNTALDQIRRDKMHQTDLELDNVAFELPELSHTEERLQAEYLMKLIQALPDGYRMVFNLYAIEGYSHKEIGDMLGITESTSKSQYSRAKNAIREVLEKLNIER